MASCRGWAACAAIVSIGQAGRGRRPIRPEEDMPGRQLLALLALPGSDFRPLLVSAQGPGAFPGDHGADAGGGLSAYGRDQLHRGPGRQLQQSGFGHDHLRPAGHGGLLPGAGLQGGFGGIGHPGRGGGGMLRGLLGRGLLPGPQDRPPGGQHSQASAIRGDDRRRDSGPRDRARAHPPAPLLYHRRRAQGAPGDLVRQPDRGIFGRARFPWPWSASGRQSARP